MICRQELVTKELRESKNNFDVVWANNKNINKLASLIYSGDMDKISETLTEALCDVPYLALATKKQLVETFEKSLQLESTIHLTLKDKDIKSFASIIFEMKKPVKKLLIKTINEKYGINVQNLKEVASFRGLVETQIVIFESLAKLAPRASVIKNVLGQVSNMLKEKEGVESIDVNDILQAVFDKANYTSLCESYSVSEKLTLKEMFDNDLSPQEIVSLLENEVGEVSDRITNLQEEAKKPKKKGKVKEEPSDTPESPEDVQSRLSGKEEQYAESSEESSEEKGEEGSVKTEEDPESKEKMSKEGFFKQLDALTKILDPARDPTEEK